MLSRILDAFRSITRDAVLIVIAVLCIILIGAGYVYFYTSFIDPSLRNRDKIIPQVNDARKTLADSRRIADQTPLDYQRQLSATLDSLTSARNAFLTPEQASKIPAALYAQAQASQVQIVDLQTQAIPTPTVKSTVITSTIRLQAQGDSYHLLDFVSNLQPAAFKGVVINNVGMSQDKSGVSKLALDLTLYSSPVVPGDPRTIPTPTPTVTPTPLVTVEPTQIPYIPLPPPPIVEATLIPFPTISIPPPTVYIPPTSIPIPPTPIPPTATPITSQTLYVVRPGDTLYSISRTYGVTVQAIMTANNLPTTNIFAGQTLVIPK